MTFRLVNCSLKWNRLTQFCFSTHSSSFYWLRTKGGEFWLRNVTNKLCQGVRMATLVLFSRITDNFKTLNSSDTQNWAYLATSRSKIQPVRVPFSSIFTLLKFFLNFFAWSAGPLKVPPTSKTFRSSVVGDIGSEGKSPATLLISHAFTPSAQASCAFRRDEKLLNSRNSAIFRTENRKIEWIFLPSCMWTVNGNLVLQCLRH